MKEKICSCCHLLLPISDFYKQKDRENGQAYCKKCFNSYCIQRWIERKKHTVAQFGGVCHDCQNSFPYPVFDFHHLDPGQKDLDWSKMRLVSEERLQRELEKCVMLCSNCHRIRHHNL